MFLPPLWQAISLVIFATYAQADGAFIHPPPAGLPGDYQDNPTYELGSVINIEWNSNAGTGATDLVLIEAYPKPANAMGSFYSTYLLKNNTKFNFVPWAVSLEGLSSDVPLGRNVVLYAATLYAGTTKIEISSHYFNVSLPSILTSAPASTVSTSTVISTTSPTTSPATQLSSSPPSTATGEAATSNSNPALSNGAVAGIAVGATIGAIMVLGGIGLLIWRYLRRRGNDASSNPKPSPAQEGYQPEPWPQKPQYNYASELSEGPVLVEAP